MRVEYHPAVEGELREIQRYYEERSPGPDELERQLGALSQNGWRVVSFAATKDGNEKPKVIVILKSGQNKK